MNVIFIDSNNKIGGIEVMFIEMAKYLVSKNYNVYFIVSEDNIYEKELENLRNVIFLKKKYNDPVEFMSNKQLKEEREFIQLQLNLSEEYYVISPYFQKLQYAMNAFEAQKGFKLVNLWPHPQHWARESTLLRSTEFTKNIKKTSKYFYQRNLLKVLEDKNAHYYGARVVPIFNNWYYSISLNPSEIETLPIQPAEEAPKSYNIVKEVKSLRVLWCGRFAYFKNEAIIEISKVLDSLSELYPDYIIEYGIVGFGSKKDTDYIKENINNKNISVEYLGEINPDDLMEVFKKYDIGIGMGLTVKKMAQVGLPAIVIDSFESGSNHYKNCNWLFDTSEGDAGDGYYYKIANEVIGNRQELSGVIANVLENPHLLELYSTKCLEYVNKYYTFEKQVQAILETAKNSTFYAGDFPVFRRSFILRKIYSTYKKVKSI